LLNFVKLKRNQLKLVISLNFKFKIVLNYEEQEF